MSAKYIVNQDRTQIIKFSNDDYIYTTKIEDDGIVMGLNLMVGSNSIGTFKNVKEAIHEIKQMFNTGKEIYAVTRHLHGGIS